MSEPLHPLEELEQALREERRALLENDVEALLRSTATKLAALRRAEALPSDPAASARVRDLSELNRANGALLARRRREVNWSLRHLGRLEAGNVYDSTGQTGARPQARCLGVG